MARPTWPRYTIFYHDIPEVTAIGDMDWRHIGEEFSWKEFDMQRDDTGSTGSYGLRVDITQGKDGMMDVEFISEDIYEIRQALRLAGIEVLKGEVPVETVRRLCDKISRTGFALRVYEDIATALTENGIPLGGDTTDNIIRRLIAERNAAVHKSTGRKETLDRIIDTLNGAGLIREGETLIEAVERLAMEFSASDAILNAFSNALKKSALEAVAEARKAAEAKG